jgi:hypothetical protein
MCLLQAFSESLRDYPDLTSVDAFLDAFDGTDLDDGGSSYRAEPHPSPHADVPHPSSAHAARADDGDAGGDAFGSAAGSARTLCGGWVSEGVHYAGCTMTRALWDGELVSPGRGLPLPHNGTEHITEDVRMRCRRPHCVRTLRCCVRALFSL